MEYEKTTTIRFSSLKCGTYEYHFEIDDVFLAGYENESLKQGNVHFDVLLDKKETAMLLHFSFKGVIETTCDRCLGAMQVPVEGEQHLCVKLSDNEVSDSEDLLILPTTAYELDLAQWLYEYVAVAMPMQHVHGTDPNGNSLCDPEMLRYLNQEPDSSTQAESTIDPRWAALLSMKEEK